MTDWSDRSAEREFFLEEFHHCTLLIAVGPPSEDRTIDDQVAALDAVINVLKENDTRVLVIAASPSPLGSQALAERYGVEEYKGIQPSDPTSVDDLAHLWIDLSDRGVAIVDVGHDDPADVPVYAARLAVRLRADKLILTDPLGGWGDPTRSFADIEDIEETAGSSGRPVVAAARRALEGGVTSINLCAIADLDAELFTFDGAGTLFTRDAYIRVNRLTLDDLPVVEELVQRGVAEGFLRERSRAEVVRVALSGMGARVSSKGHLAAIGSLETLNYLEERLGEVTSLYTVNRFSGEGAGGQLLEGLVASAFALDLRGVFACTVSDGAAQFFERHGFREVPHSRVPASKWEGYDIERRTHIRALFLDLEGSL